VPAPVEVDEPLEVAVVEPAPASDVEVTTGAPGVPVVVDVERSAVGVLDVAFWVVVPFPAFALLAGWFAAAGLEGGGAAAAGGGALTARWSTGTGAASAGATSGATDGATT
jgi:hypothetical protein